MAITSVVPRGPQKASIYFWGQCTVPSGPPPKPEPPQTPHSRGASPLGQEEEWAGGVWEEAWDICLCTYDRRDAGSVQ